MIDKLQSFVKQILSLNFNLLTIAPPILIIYESDINFNLNTAFNILERLKTGSIQINYIPIPLSIRKNVLENPEIFEMNANVEYQKIEAKHQDDDGNIIDTSKQSANVISRNNQMNLGIKIPKEWYNIIQILSSLVVQDFNQLKENYRFAVITPEFFLFKNMTLASVNMIPANTDLGVDRDVYELTLMFDFGVYKKDSAQKTTSTIITQTFTNPN